MAHLSTPANNSNMLAGSIKKFDGCLVVVDKSATRVTTVKLLNFRGQPRNCCNYPKILIMWFNHK